MRSSVPLLIVLTACATATPEPAPPPSEPAHLEITGPLRFVDHAEILYAQRELARRDEVLQLRLDRRGDLRTLALERITVSVGEPYAMAIAAVERYKNALGVENVKDLA